MVNVILWKEGRRMWTLGWGGWQMYKKYVGRRKRKNFHKTWYLFPT